MSTLLHCCRASLVLTLIGAYDNFQLFTVTDHLITFPYDACVAVSCARLHICVSCCCSTCMTTLSLPLTGVWSCTANKQTHKKNCLRTHRYTCTLSKTKSSLCAAVPSFLFWDYGVPTGKATEETMLYFMGENVQQ